MIILDTNILRGFKLDSVSSDLLKTIRTAGVESVGVPWVVLEELASHRAVPYREKYEAASDALKRFEKATPWPVTALLPPLELERFQQYWREQYLAIVDEIPTSETALREAAFRESNILPPCKAVAINEGGDDMKTGGRDAAIWLTAVEYAREHRGETVYFVSRNTKDFGDGTAYPPLMDKDLEDIRDRFVHLTSLGAVVKEFAVPTEVDEERVREILSAPETATLVAEEAMRAYNGQVAYLHAMSVALFECTPASVLDLSAETQTDRRSSPVGAVGWLRTPTTLFDSVRDVEAYSIGDHVWCTATARWLLGGPALLRAQHDGVAVGCAWETRVLVSPTNSEARPALLRTQRPQGITAAELSKLPASSVAPRTVYVLPHRGAWNNPRTALGGVSSGPESAGLEW
ncbi:PIN domain-containing protein [Streptomyces canus]|uniref:PIN domain-containing protein n=1 Tax=Streptomyces canus TaxID=58343 RepID=UPI002E32508E|nr:PIN domain-containing protein [Streptomyces canus]